MLCHCQVSTTACKSARGGLIENSLELIKSPRRPYTIQMYHYIKILTNVVCVFWSMNKIFLLLPIPIKTSKLSSGIICSSPQSRETIPLITIIIWIMMITNLAMGYVVNTIWMAELTELINIYSKDGHLDILR